MPYSHLIHLEDIGAELRQFESEIFDNNIDEHMAKKFISSITEIT